MVYGITEWIRLEGITGGSAIQLPVPSRIPWSGLFKIVLRQLSNISTTSLCGCTPWKCNSNLKKLYMSLLDTIRNIFLIRTGWSRFERELIRKSAWILNNISSQGSFKKHEIPCNRDVGKRQRVLFVNHDHGTGCRQVIAWTQFSAQKPVCSFSVLPDRFNSWNFKIIIFNILTKANVSFVATN